MTKNNVDMIFMVGIPLLLFVMSFGAFLYVAGERNYQEAFLISQYNFTEDECVQATLSNGSTYSTSDYGSYTDCIGLEGKKFCDIVFPKFCSQYCHTRQVQVGEEDKRIEVDPDFLSNYIDDNWICTMDRDELNNRHYFCSKFGSVYKNETYGCQSGDSVRKARELIR